MNIANHNINREAEQATTIGNQRNHIKRHKGYQEKKNARRRKLRRRLWGILMGMERGD